MFRVDFVATIAPPMPPNEVDLNRSSCPDRVDASASTPWENDSEKSLPGDTCVTSGTAISAESHTCPSDSASDPSHLTAAPKSLDRDPESHLTGTPNSFDPNVARSRLTPKVI